MLIDREGYTVIGVAERSFTVRKSIPSTSGCRWMLPPPRGHAQRIVDASMMASRRRPPGAGASLKSAAVERASSLPATTPCIQVNERPSSRRPPPRCRVVAIQRQGQSHRHGRCRRRPRGRVAAHLHLERGRLALGTRSRTPTGDGDSNCARRRPRAGHPATHDRARCLLVAAAVALALCTVVSPRRPTCFR